MKQAIVVIHGIGEQRPMATLRSFVNGILPYRRDKLPKYHSKPDRFNSLLELRLLRSLRRGKKPTTDYFELYWAHHMRDSRLSHVYQWMAKLLLRCPWNAPQGLKSIYFLVWVTVLFTAAMLFWGWISSGLPNDQYFALFTQWQGQLSVAGGFFWLLQVILSYFLLRYVADAARYLTPSPDNIEQRNKIRQEGLALLESLHSSGNYTRIIIVGHSLGSVIGYDLIRLLWDKYREPSNIDSQVMPELESFDRERREIFNSNMSLGAKIEKYQQKQHRLWRELRRPGYKIPWLITDFITLGSPLAHAELLLSDKGQEFKDRRKEYEFPACPPESSLDLVSYFKNYKIKENGLDKIVGMRIAHHGAPFSCTRWSNLYFPHRWLFWGDIIGGPLSNVLGKGIKDIPVRLSYRAFEDKKPRRAGERVLSMFANTLVSHVCYWKLLPSGGLRRGVRKLFAHKHSRKQAVSALISELKLESLRSKDKWPAP